MFRSRFGRIGLLWLVLIGLAFSPDCQAQILTSLSWVTSELPDGSYVISVVEFHATNASGPVPDANVYQGPLLAVTNCGTNVPFEVLASTSLISIYAIYPGSAPGSLAETLTLFDGNAATNLYVVLNPVFQTQPQSQSLFVGSNASFTAQAFHSTGYQWQMNATNLFDDGHFSGTTNATLTIANVSTNDAGTYTVIAEHPTNPATSSDAVLAVFKPIQITVAGAAPTGFVRILAGNADQSPFEAWRVANVSFYFSADASLDFTNWTLSANPVILTNGVLQCDFSTDGMTAGFWQVVEQP